MTSADFAPIINALIAAIALTMTVLVNKYVPLGIAAFQARTGILLTAQQTASVKDAAITAKGIAETMMDQGALRLENIKPTDPAIIKLAQDAIARVPASALAIDKSTSSMAETITGLVDTSPKPPVIPSIAAAQLVAQQTLQRSTPP
jgi:hypothetical protein